MRKFIILLLMGTVCTSAATAGYSYTVSGTVYYNSTGTVATGAVVTFEIEWASGYWSSSSKFSNDTDGSFSFTTYSDSDPKGKNMRLKASKGFFAGSTTWVCAGYSETQNVWLSLTIKPNPNLSVVVQPALFPNPGAQPRLAVTASLDEPAPIPVMVYEFSTVITYDPGKMNCIPVSSSDSQFVVDGVVSDEGILIVHGTAMLGPVPLEMMPESFFDVFCEVPVVDPPSLSTVTVEETSILYTLDGPQSPYPHRTIMLLGEPEKCKTAFLIEGYADWEEALQSERPYANIRPLNKANWEEYMAFWRSEETEKEGQPYPETTFMPCTVLDDGSGTAIQSGMLYVWEGGGGGGLPEEPGLVMAWGFDQTQEGSYASAWRYDYGLDPDLRNCMIQVTVTPPASVNINAVSFSIIDIAGRMRTWWWAVPAAIPSGAATTVKINTAQVGVLAATPAATGYMNVPGFNLAQSQFFDVDENFQYIFGQLPVPPPGQQQSLWGWNYWHNLIVTKNTAAHKGIYTKYGQKPEVIDPEQPPRIYGWDEYSIYPYRIVADDWPCSDDRPVTDIHWWGSFIGWTQPTLPPVLPKAFHIGIWTDVPIGDPDNPFNFSHPGKLIWENYCTNWVWNFAGYDIDPRCDYPDMTCMKNETCFQFTQLLSEDEWFHQRPNDDPNASNIYWLSIAAVYDDIAAIRYPWGWKSRPHVFNDDAVRITPPNVVEIGTEFMEGVPIQLPEYPREGVSWDMAFEITTNEPRPPASADLNYDGIVNLADFAIFASQWLSAGV